MTHVWPDSLKIKGATNRPIKHEFHYVGLCDKKRCFKLIMSKAFIVRTCPPIKIKPQYIPSCFQYPSVLK